MLTLEIKTENAAFDGMARGPELARIMRNLADELAELEDESEGGEFHLFDLNGNRCGMATLHYREEPEGDELEPPLDTPSLDTSFHDHEMDTDDA